MMWRARCLGEQGPFIGLVQVIVYNRLHHELVSCAGGGWSGATRPIARLVHSARAARAAVIAVSAFACRRLH